MTMVELSKKISRINSHLAEIKLSQRRIAERFDAIDKAVKDGHMSVFQAKIRKADYESDINTLNDYIDVVIKMGDSL